MRYRHLSLAIPMMGEADNVPALLQALDRQTFRSFTLYCCVNNEEGWSRGTDFQRRVYEDNQRTLAILREWRGGEVVVLDHSSEGCGFSGKCKGVGWARKFLFEAVGENSDPDELVVSLDADTAFDNNYLSAVYETMNCHCDASALAVPYYHPLSGDEVQDRSLLRYEIYMRHYFLKLLESSNPYAFTALGSAMVFPLWAYRRVGGITPLQGGEDFYLLQKFCKTGRLLRYLDEYVRPQGRVSWRVPFGTGPAVAAGLPVMEQSYPLYPEEAFDAVSKTFSLFPQLYEEEQETPMSHFLRQQLHTEHLWEPLRKNYKSRALFVHACQERVDGLRILQYLKTWPLRSAEEELRCFASRYEIEVPDHFSFKSSSLETIDGVRDALFHLEMKWRAATMA